MIYIEAPNIIRHNKLSLFIAGGITGCENWQKKLCDMLEDLDIAIYNPRRKNFDIKKNKAGEQIKWEHDMLDKADIISFWFSKETVQPIVLYELGKYTRKDVPLVIGCDPDYSRKSDVEIQTSIDRPEIKIKNSIEGLALKIRILLKNY
jgi:hypothetical protein